MTRIPRLTPTWRKTVLVLHIAGGVGWMGLDVGLVILAATGLTTANGRTAVSCYTAIGLVVPPAVLTLSLIMLTTGLILGLGTKWGLLRYWWVLVKLALGLVLTGLALFALLPATMTLSDAVASEGDGGGAAVRASLGAIPVQLMFPPVVSFLALGFALVVSVFKPWGRLHKFAAVREQVGT
ncbi:hypothetical protein [Arthrobacter sp. ISL-28]|uniref:hypothetical protein n=1 Tax=Arthrobacter sp. ISL-28 TaxID=2819108 RepID=UPI001BEC8C4C|nr:hypothetical protein [Arthrobacter sp. ISL-28]MBT2523853.1 hypothetical protein [Arthrobacter sp. ISL-28]